MLAALTTIMILHWLALITPGANVLLISQLAASGDKRGALYASLGICAVAPVWAMLAALGLNAVFTAVPQLRLAVQMIGAAYLLYMAYKLWSAKESTAQNDVAPMSAASAFRMGCLTNLTNPKSALFFGSVFAAALPHEPSAVLLIAAVAIVTLNAFVWHFFLALAFSHPRVQAGYARQRRFLNRLSSVIVGAFGTKLIVSTVYELKR